jgi:hypothetical protein
MEGIKSVVYLIVAVASFFLILGSITMPFLSKSYTSGCKTTWVCKAGDTDASVGKTNCSISADANTSTVTGTNVCGSGNCLGCSTGSSYESWNAVSTGIIILVFFVAVIGFAIKVMPKIG